MHYVDGYVLPVAKKHLAAYARIAKKASKIWREHGALEVRECVGDDLAATFCEAFPKQFKAKKGETIVFSWVVFKSRAHRDRVGAKVMKDKRIAKMMSSGPMPFDCHRMVYGGFKAIVEA